MSLAKPDAASAMVSLKNFQRRTVDHVFRRLYLDEDATRRFLVADEVGLGKTVVARGVIAKAVEHLWDKVERVDVVYICSNGDIARQNIKRLRIGGHGGPIFSERLTLMPLHMKDFHPKLNFVSFSPGTSFDIGQSLGTRRERALLYHLMSTAWSANSAAAKNVMQGGVYDADQWRSYLEYFSQNEAPDIDAGFERVFCKALAERPDLRSRFDDLQNIYSTRRADPTREQREKRSRFVGEMRQLLAEHCVRLLEPDLVIMDEFQRFPGLLHGDDEVANLAKQLFSQPECRVLLLSATPYKMFTSLTAGDQEDHYQDFLETIGFLMQSKTNLDRLQAALKTHRASMVTDGLSDAARLSAKQGVETLLCKVMSRTERLAASHDRNGMLCEARSAAGAIETGDFLAYRAYERVAAALGARDSIELWKSAPYLLNFMDEYELKRKVHEAVKSNQPILKEALHQTPAAFLTKASLENYSALDPANGRMRGLIADTLDTGMWKLLWMPASLPYYEPAGPYAETALRASTKALIFSSWKVAPKAIAAIVSYEAERRMVQLGKPDARQADRPEGPLKFEIKDGRLDGAPNFTSLYPCYTFATLVDPLLIASERTRAGMPCALSDIRDVVRSRISPLLRPLLELATLSGEEDHKWYWAAPMLLDQHADVDAASVLRPKGVDGEEDPIVPGSAYAQHVDEILEWLRQYRLHPTGKLGRCPKDLLNVLINMALGGAATCSLRAMIRLFAPVFKSDPGEAMANPAEVSSALGPAATEAARGFQSLFNVPEHVCLVRALYPGEPYWQRILEYSIDGNLQSVLDEYAHVLSESEPLNLEKVASARPLGAHIRDSASLRATVLQFDEFKVGSEGRVEISKERLRCRFALRFGEGESEEGTEPTREDQVRSAFNSPFRPFVLASTSVGQEGLDFHSYCHAIYHWNLPTNPVDLEQREGRIHRFKCLVVRKNAAAVAGISTSFQANEDPWRAIFAVAESGRAADESELNPFWVLPGEFKIERRVPLYPASRDAEFFQALKRTLTMYRMAFGQPRQDDLLRVLAERAGNTNDDWMQWCISLAPRVGPAV